MTDSKTATERLRKLLDARGVEWRDSEPYGANAVTKFDVRGVTLRYVEYPDYCWLDYHENETLTPEQAIAATLGSGECEFVIEDNMNETGGMGDVWFRCTSCDTCFDYYADDWLMKQNYCPNCGKAVKR